MAMDIRIDLDSSSFTPKFHHCSRMQFTATMRHDYHSHPVYHILLMSSGKTIFRLDDNFNEIEKGHMVLIHPNETHQFTTGGYTFSYYEVTFQLLGDAGVESGRALWQILKNLYPEVPEADKWYFGNRHSFSIVEQFFIKHIEKLNESTAKGDIFAQASMVDFILEFGLLLSEMVCTEEDLSPVDHVKRLLRRNYDRDITLSDLAKEVGVHPNYLCTLFKKHTGETIFSYLNNLRITEAKRLLEFTDLSILEISNQLGISSQSYFSQQFKNREGMTPSEYRRKISSPSE